MGAVVGHVHARAQLRHQVAPHAAVLLDARAIRLVQGLIASDFKALGRRALFVERHARFEAVVVVLTAAIAAATHAIALSEAAERVV